MFRTLWDLALQVWTCAKFSQWSWQQCWECGDDIVERVSSLNDCIFKPYSTQLNLFFSAFYCRPLSLSTKGHCVWNKVIDENMEIKQGFRCSLCTKGNERKKTPLTTLTAVINALATVGWRAWIWTLHSTCCINNTFSLNLCHVYEPLNQPVLEQSKGTGWDRRREEWNTALLRRHYRLQDRRGGGRPGNTWKRDLEESLGDVLRTQLEEAGSDSARQNWTETCKWSVICSSLGWTGHNTSEK